MSLAMKAFVIESRRGFVAIPERIASYSFPLSFGSREAATHFPFASAAQRSIRKHKLDVRPISAHVEEVEYEC